MSDTTRFDVAVVGGGLIGSAAARHLAEAGHSVAVIAAPEPSDWTTSPGPFASHYDSGRITRTMSMDPVWAELAVRSIGRYADIEARSGIRFHEPLGLAWLGTGIEPAVTNAIERGAAARMVTADWLAETCGIVMPQFDGMEAAWEDGPAGVVNPRQLAAAQLALAAQANATVHRKAAAGLRPADGAVAIVVGTETVVADRVLVAAGAYTEHLTGVDLQLDRQLRTTLRVDMGEMPGLPSIICDQVEHPYIGDMYANPPVTYPDGRRLFKIGCEVVDPPRAEDVSDIAAWFGTGGDPEEAAALLETTRTILPNAAISSWDTVPCVITRTARRYPLIGWVDDRVAIATGGNGSAAKCSDELGRLASELFSAEGWMDTALGAATFAPR